MPEPQRSEFLNSACSGDSRMRQEVESLIARTRGNAESLYDLVEDAMAHEVASEALHAGQTIGHYAITALIGTGGMAEVYRARDTRLNRDVAIKVLPQAFARDRERVARFQREAQLLATLNHPRIAAIYGLEESHGVYGLALEFVDGETLAERISRGPLPVADALEIARQIAEALEAAHAKSIVHRDLKPANIKLTPNGAVKVLDFGLAKIFHSDSSLSDASMDGALSTKANVILGTASYMSPEQARGKDVDKRADIWAWGVVLYEMLTGRRIFDGDSAMDVIAKIAVEDPDWTRLPAETPASIRTLLRRALQKDPDRRLRDIGDARIEIDEAVAPPASGPVETRRRFGKRAVFLTGAAVLVVLIAAVLASRYFQRSPDSAVVRFQIETPPLLNSAGFLNVSAYQFVS